MAEKDQSAAGGNFHVCFLFDRIAVKIIKLVFSG